MTKLSVPPAPLGRSRIGRYEVLYPLAQGGMASLHLGRLSGMAGFEKLVAIKIIHSHLAGNEGFVKMFLDEARLAARIHHPNVGEVIEVGADDGLYYMICELIVGQSLRNVEKRARSLGIRIPYAASADIAARVCQGLHEAHEQRDAHGDPVNIVHRDVSPSNILISYSGFVKIIDFGIALAKDRMSHTDVGTLKGKIGYMPPEQIRGEPLDRRSDIFSLGVVLYQALTDTHPFPGHSDAERMQKILTGKFTPPSEIAKDIPPDLDRIVSKALASQPDDRYRTAADMGRDLSSYVYRSALPPGSWDGTAVLADLMSRLFEEEIARHHKQMMRVAEIVRRSSTPPPADEREASRGSQGTALTAAGTPATLRQRSRRRRAMRFAAAIVPLVTVVVAVAVGVGQTAQERLSVARVQGGASPPEPAVPVKADIHIEFDIEPAMAALAIDGRALEPGTRDIAIPADRRAHSIEIKADGYETSTVRIVADRDQRVVQRLAPAARSSPPTGEESEAAQAAKRKRAGTKRSGKGIGLVDSPYGP